MAALGVIAACFFPAVYADTLLSTTSYSFTSTAQSYTTPANTNYVVIKVGGQVVAVASMDMVAVVRLRRELSRSRADKG